MKKLLGVLNVQSMSDVITNSSSELFVLFTDKSVETVDEILQGITSGVCNSEVFSLEEFRKWEKDPLSVDPDDAYTFKVVDGWLDVDEDLDGAVLVFSTDENSVPWEAMEKISEIFDGYRQHLG